MARVENIPVMRGLKRSSLFRFTAARKQNASSRFRRRKLLRADEDRVLLNGTPRCCRLTSPERRQVLVNLRTRSTIEQCHTIASDQISCHGSRHNLTFQSDSVLCLTGTQHVLFSSNTTGYPIANEIASRVWRTRPRYRLSKTDGRFWIKYLKLFWTQFNQYIACFSSRYRWHYLTNGDPTW